jgi:hypothetical protein
MSFYFTYLALLLLIENNKEKMIIIFSRRITTARYQATCFQSDQNQTENYCEQCFKCKRKKIERE